jgi:hypothetical protein
MLSRVFGLFCLLENHVQLGLENGYIILHFVSGLVKISAWMDNISSCAVCVECLVGMMMLVHIDFFYFNF